jgi:hypothetical protein
VNRGPERLGDLLPGLVADLARRHGIQPPTTLTNRSGMTKFRKKPVVIEAMQWTGDNINEIWDWAGADHIYGPTEKNPDELIILTLEDGRDGQAKHVASLNDWIIRGVQGEFYPCKPDIFEATYEQVDAA